MARLFTAIFFILIFSLPLIAQNNQSDNGHALTKANYEYGQLISVHSDTMNKDFPALVFTPENYKKSKENYNVVYLLHGHNNRLYQKKA